MSTLGLDIGADMKNGRVITSKYHSYNNQHQQSLSYYMTILTFSAVFYFYYRRFHPKIERNILRAFCSSNFWLLQLDVIMSMFGFYVLQHAVNTCLALSKLRVRPAPWK